MKSIGTASDPAGRPDYSKQVIRVTTRFPTITLALILANVAIWSVMSRPSEQQADALVRAYAFSPVRMTSDLKHNDDKAAGIEALRSVSSLFVHEQDFSHVGLNMLFLALFGISVERRLGRWSYAILYLTAGALTCAAYFVICPKGQPSFGASSAVCGVLSAYIFLFLKTRPISTLIPLAMLVLNLYAASNVNLMTQVGFSFFAHLSGFLIGFVCALCLAPLSPTRPRARLSR